MRARCHHGEVYIQAMRERTYCGCCTHTCGCFTYRDGYLLNDIPADFDLADNGTCMSACRAKSKTRSAVDRFLLLKPH